MTRIGTAAQDNQVVQYIQQNQTQENVLEQQISTGLKSQNFSGLGTQAEQFVNLGGQVSQLNSYVDTNNTVSTRMQTMALSLNSIESLATQFVGNLPAEAYNTQGETIQEQAQQVLNQIGGYLNTQDGAGYVFSGSKTTTAPFVLSGLPNPGSLTTSVGVPPPNGYYAGDSVIAKATIDNNVSVSYGVTAANPAIQQFVQVLNYLANAPAFDPKSATDTANVTQATKMLNESVAQLQTLQGSVALQQGQLSTTLTTQNNAISLAKTSMSSIDQVDPATAITELDTLQTQLQASYQTVSMLGQLSLVNYIK